MKFSPILFYVKPETPDIEAASEEKLRRWYPAEEHRVTPLTLDHKRFLKFKSYSFPFLCEPRFRLLEDDSEIDAVIRDLNEADNNNNNNNGFQWIDVEDDDNNSNNNNNNNRDEDDDGDGDIQDDKFVFFSTKNDSGLGWADFLRAQETSLEGDDVL